MTVEELLKSLEGVEPTRLVVIAHPESPCGDWLHVDGVDGPNDGGLAAFTLFPGDPVGSHEW